MNEQDFVDPGKTTPGIETATENDSAKDSTTTTKQEDAMKIKSELIQNPVEDDNNESIANTTHDSIVVADTTLILFLDDEEEEEGEGGGEGGERDDEEERDKTLTPINEWYIFGKELGNGSFERNRSAPKIILLF